MSYKIPEQYIVRSTKIVPLHHTRLVQQPNDAFRLIARELLEAYMMEAAERLLFRHDCPITNTVSFMLDGCVLTYKELHAELNAAYAQGLADAKAHTNQL